MVDKIKQLYEQGITIRSRDVGRTCGVEYWRTDQKNCKLHGSVQAPGVLRCDTAILSAYLWYYFILKASECHVLELIQVQNAQEAQCRTRNTVSLRRHRHLTLNV